MKYLKKSYLPMLHPVQGFQLGCGGDQGTTPAACGALSSKAFKICSDSKDIGAEICFFFH